LLHQIIGDQPGRFLGEWNARHDRMGRDGAWILDDAVNVRGLKPRACVGQVRTNPTALASKLMATEARQFFTKQQLRFVL
jgi:hypothetical protein